MNRRDLLKAFVAGTAGILIPDPERRVWALDRTMIAPKSMETGWLDASMSGFQKGDSILAFMKGDRIAIDFISTMVSTEFQVVGFDVNKQLSFESPWLTVGEEAIVPSGSIYQVKYRQDISPSGDFTLIAANPESRLRMYNFRSDN